MGAAAEVEKLASLVYGDFFIGLGELLDEMALHEVAFTLELLESFVTRQKFASVRQILLDELLHFLLDLLEIFRRERSRAVKVVEESVLSRRTVAELGLGEEFEHSRGEQVRRRMPIDFERLRIAFLEDAQVGVLVERTGEIDQIAIRLATRAASARRGLKDLTTSSAVVPFGTSLT